MLDHGRQGHGQRTRQFAHGSGAQGEALHHGTPAAISQRLEGPIEVDRLVKHVLDYKSARFDSQVEALLWKRSQLWSMSVSTRVRDVRGARDAPVALDTPQACVVLPPGVEPSRHPSEGHQ